MKINPCDEFERMWFKRLEKRRRAELTHWARFCEDCPFHCCLVVIAVPWCFGVYTAGAWLMERI